MYVCVIWNFWDVKNRESQKKIEEFVDIIGGDLKFVI